MSVILEFITVIRMPFVSTLKVTSAANAKIHILAVEDSVKVSYLALLLGHVFHVALLHTII